MFRGGWPFRNPPNCQFDLNTRSPQAKGLVGWWPTLGSRGSTLRDYSGRHADLAPTAFNKYIHDPEVGTALAFNGAMYFTTTSGPPIVKEHSISAWIRIHSHGAGIEEFIYTLDHAVVLRIQGSIGSIDYLTRTGGFVSSLTAAWVVNTWHLVTGTYDGTTQRLYLDGRQVDSDPQNGNLFSPTTTVQLGTWAGSDLLTDSDVADPRLWDRTLSPAEIWAMAHDAKWELYAPRVRWWPGYVAAGAPPAGNPWYVYAQQQ